MLLCIPPSASLDEIKVAYWLLAKKYHPVVSEEPDAEARLKEVARAYVTLKDPFERRAYDRFLEQGGHQPTFDSGQDACYNGHSTLPAEKSFARKGLRWLILLLWILTGIAARTARLAAVFVLTIVLAVFQSIFPLVAITLIVAGLIFEGNPFHWATWDAHPQLTFLCFGFPILAFMVATVFYRLTEWLAHDGPLFPSLESRINDIINPAVIYRTIMRHMQSTWL